MGFASSYLLDVNGTIFQADSSKDIFHPIPLFQNKNIKLKAIAAGRYHVLFLTSNGRLFVYWYNYYGQLGLGDTNHRDDEPTESTYFKQNNINIEHVVCGSAHTLLVIGDDKKIIFIWW